jgi:hypothetical protein
VTARDLTGEKLEPDREAPEPKRVRTQAAKAAQRERIAELTRQGYTVLDRGSGLTVFRFGGRR